MISTIIMLSSGPVEKRNENMTRCSALGSESKHLGIQEKQWSESGI